MERKLLLLICTCAVALSSASEGFPADKPSAAAPNEIPFKLSHGFLITVQGRIGKLDHLIFLLDTGATSSVLSRSIAQHLGLALRPGHVFSFSQVLDMERSTIADIQFGPVRVSNAPMLVCNLKTVSDFAAGADAVIGTDLLSLTNLTVDFDSHTVRFRPVNRAATGSPGKLLTLRVTIQGHDMCVLLDTGLKQELVLYRDRVLERIPDLRVERERNGATMGAHLHGRKTVVPEIRVGSKTYSLDTFLIEGEPQVFPPGVDGYLAGMALRARRINLNFDSDSLSWE